MSSARILPWVGLALLGVLFFSRLAGFPLQDPDEGRYAEIPLEMVANGDWITPTLAGVPYLEKPPLFYWLVAGAFEIFGVSEFAARLIPALAAFLTVLMVYAFGRRIFSRRAALLGAGILATTPLFFFLSQAVVIDMLLTACMTATLLSFFLVGEEEGRNAWRWTSLVAVSAALGVLAKGLVALVLPGAIALVVIMLRRDGATLRSLLRPWPALIFVGMVAPWFVAVSLAQPEFLDIFFVQHHFNRFLDAEGNNIAHPEGPFFYLPVLLVVALPWTLVVLLVGLRRQGRAAFGILRRDVVLFLVVWAGGTVLFFSASSSKLPTYVLPAFPPFALLVGAWLDISLDDESEFDPLRRFIWPVLLLLGGLLSALGVFAWLFPATLAAWIGEETGDVTAVGAGVLGGGGALLAGALLWRRWLRAEKLLPVDSLLLLILTLGATEVGAVAARSVAKSGIHAARVINAQAQPDDSVILYHELSQSLQFYVNRRLVHVGSLGELAPLVKLLPEAERREWFWKADGRLVEAWNSEKRVFLYLSQARLADLEEKLGQPARILARNRSRVLVDNRPRKQGE